MSDALASAARPRTAWILHAEARDAAARGEVRVFSLTAPARLERGLLRAGIAEIVEFGALDALPSAPSERIALFRSDRFYDERVIAAVLDAEDDVIVRDDTGSAAAANVAGSRTTVVATALREESTANAIDGVGVVDPLAIAPAYNAALRKFDPPFLHRAEPGRVREVENRIFASSYKGITDLVTKWVFPIPARAVVRLLARRGTTPNTVTAVSYLLTALAAWLFYEGWFATGLVCAWVMTFLDTVDGKLARVTLTSSSIGNVLDHGLDLIHPPIWWAAWAYGLAPGAAGFELAMWIVVAGYVTGRLLEGVFLLFFKMEIFTWRPFDAFFRTIIARRNPNLLLLTGGVIAGEPAWGYLAVAVWTVACHVVPIVRIGQAFGRKRRGEVIRPWHEEQAEAAQQAAGIAVSTLVLTLLVATASLAAPPPPDLDPSARLPKGDDAVEYWDLTAKLDGGHWVFARFMITNIGPGDHSAIAIGHVVKPDGTVVKFQNGKRQGKWRLSDDRLQLDVGASELDLRGPRYRLDVHKDDVAIDLRFEPRGSPQPMGLPPGYHFDLLDPAAPASGTIWYEGLDAPREVAGRAGFVHTWTTSAEAGLVTRRVEAFSLQPDSLYVLAVTVPQGAPIHWFAGPDGLHGALGDHLRTSGVLEHGAKAYAVPRRIEIENGVLKGMVRLDRNILSHDSLAEIPQPFRFFVALQMKPWRVWAESAFAVTLRANSEPSPTRIDGAGITVVTFSTPTESP